MDKRWIDYLKEPKQKMPEYVFLFADGTFQWKELVRCKDCKHHGDEENGMVYCPNIVGGWVEDDWFCADGERREDGKVY